MFITSDFFGTIHDAMAYVNSLNCAQHLFQVLAVRDSTYILIFKVTSREDQVKVREELNG